MTTKSEQFPYSGCTIEKKETLKEMRERLRCEMLTRDKFLEHTLPKHLVSKFGLEKIATMCVKYGNRSTQKARNRKCSHCGSHNVMFTTGVRCGVRGLKCRRCKKITPLPARCLS